MRSKGPLSPEAGAIAVARIGDVFDLGPHRIICGSATDPETLRRLIAGDPPARLVLTDEPYNVPIAGHVTGGRQRGFAIASGEMTDAVVLGPEALAKTFADVLNAISKDAATAIIKSIYQNMTHDIALQAISLVAGAMAFSVVYPGRRLSGNP